VRRGFAIIANAGGMKSTLTTTAIKKKSTIASFQA
jgi:hypothetical protein